MDDMAEHKDRMEKENHTLRHKTLAIMIAIAGAAILTALGIFIGKPLIDMLNDPASFQAWISSLGGMGRFAFMGVMALQIIIAWLPGEPLEIGAGYAFGFLEGSLLCMAGIAAGSMFVFFMVRCFGRRFATLFFPAEKIDNLPILRDMKRLTLLLFFIFAIPGTPKDILTYGVGLTRMKTSSWLFISCIARIPPVITSTLCGSALGEQHYILAAAVTVVTILLSLFGLLFYRRRFGKLLS